MGSLVKNILTSAINKDRDGNIAINDAKDAVSVINTEKPENSTTKYSLWKVESVPPTVRKPKPKGIPIKGIRKMHSFSSSGSGVKAARLSCKLCTVSLTCESCKLTPDTISEEKVKAARYSSNQDNEDSEEEEDVEIEEDESADDCGDETDEESGQEEEDAQDEDSEDEDFRPDDIVWALFSRQWYCARVVSLSEVPKELHRQLSNSRQDSVIVRFYACQSYCRVPVNKVEVLGETLLDKKRMLKHPQAYLEALSDKAYEF